MRFRKFLVVAGDLLWFPLLVFSIWNASLVTYGLQLGKGQAEILFGAEEISLVMKDATVADSVKVKLRLIEEIRQFAFDSIGLTRSDNYTTYFDQEGKRLMYVVTGSEPFALKPYEWSFPVVGTVPYKGFFDKKLAESEHQRIRSMGWDADIGGASGWSTLGWFKDPVLSQMLKYNTGDLAELIIHELTHSTVFIQDDVTYNENLATFVGIKGAIWFLVSRYGKESPEYREYLDGNYDELLRKDFMLYAAQEADSAYKLIPNEADDDLKIRIKASLFGRLAAESSALSFRQDTTFHRRFSASLRTSGNTVFLQYTRYTGKLNDFDSIFNDLRGDLRQFMNWVKEKGAQISAPYPD